MFSKLLIADRGEIVMRVARTCERLGIRTIVAHAASENAAVYLSACDEAVAIVGESADTLDASALIAAAKERGAEAIHPGCGAWSRDPSFAQAVVDGGLVFVGPTPEILRRVTDELACPELARQAGIRALPICGIDTANAEDALARAFEVGYPLCVRGGKSSLASESVDSEDELMPAIARVRDAVGTTALRLEQRLDRPRLLSVQVVADGAHAIALADVEHSLAWHSRRLLEEAPAPALSGAAGERQRIALREAAVRAVVEAGVVGCASVDFQLDTGHRLYFVGLRPGLALDHALAEMCTRLDLVELQLRIASGERLAETVLRVQRTGHAIQARLYAEAEDAAAAPAELVALRWPMLAPGRLRIDSDLALGTRHPYEIEPLVARVIGYGPTRHQALLALDRALAETTIDPLSTNLQLLRDVLGDESFRAGQFDCDFTARLLAQPAPMQ